MSLTLLSYVCHHLAVVLTATDSCFLACPLCLPVCKHAHHIRRVLAAV